MRAAAPSDARRYLVAGLAGLAVALVGAGVLVVSEQRQPAGPLAPDVEYPRLDGTRVRLSSLRGRVVLVDFWATWCPPCREEMPMLVELTRRLEPRGLSLMAIAEDDPPSNVALVTGFAGEVPGLSRHAVLGDPAAEQAFGVRNLPTLFIVDRDGSIAARFVGRVREEQILPVVERLLSGG